MDSSIHTRSYQDPSMTYDTVLSSYTTSYPEGGFLMKKGKGEPIKDLCMQYLETDWEYTKRLASHFETVVIPDFRAGGTKYYFGITSSGVEATINTHTYKAIRDNDEYQFKKGWGLSISELDATYFSLWRYRDVYSLGSQIVLNGKPVYIHKIETILENEELLHTYHMKTLRGFDVPKVYNNKSVGVSFYGTILDVKKDIVQVTLKNDENKDGCGVRWFPYATPYSTDDGTGFYAMPEIGDDVRMYIPTEDEAGAYVISATHLESSASDERVNPDYKSIMNKYHKEILFTPTSLIITNNNGMSIQLLDDEGIKIISDKEIHIKSEDIVNIVSTQENISVIAPEEVLFEQSETKSQLKDNIAFNGAQVHLD